MARRKLHHDRPVDHGARYRVDASRCPVLLVAKNARSALAFDFLHSGLVFRYRLAPDQVRGAVYVSVSVVKVIDLGQDFTPLLSRATPSAVSDHFSEVNAGIVDKHPLAGRSCRMVGDRRFSQAL
jgi:hypothetical protein